MTARSLGGDTDGFGIADGFGVGVSLQGLDELASAGRLALPRTAAQTDGRGIRRTCPQPVASLGLARASDASALTLTKRTRKPSGSAGTVTNR